MSPGRVVPLLARWKRRLAGVGQQQPTSCLVQSIVAHCFEVMYFGCFDFRGELGFLNCDDICMCVVNKQFELLEFVFDSVYVDLQYDEIDLTFTAGSVSLYCVCEVVVVPYVDAVVAVTHACLLRECDGARLMAMLVWGMDEVW